MSSALWRHNNCSQERDNVITDSRPSTVISYAKYILVIPPRVSNIRRVYLLLLKIKSSKGKTVWNIFSTSFENMTKYQSKKSDHLFAVVFCWSAFFLANRKLYRQRMRNEASGSGEATPAGHIAQLLLTGDRPSGPVSVQLQERWKTHLSICSSHDGDYGDFCLEYDEVGFSCR